MSPREYRSIVTGIQGRKPPCIRCNDSGVSFCMKTGFECQKFARYSALPMTREMMSPLSGASKRSCGE